MRGSSIVPCWANLRLKCFVLDVRPHHCLPRAAHGLAAFFLLLRTVLFPWADGRPPRTEQGPQSLAPSGCPDLGTSHHSAGLDPRTLPISQPEAATAEFRLTPATGWRHAIHPPPVFSLSLSLSHTPQSGHLLLLLATYGTALSGSAFIPSLLGPPTLLRRASTDRSRDRSLAPAPNRSMNP